jgi:D-amino-acid oxidase
VAEIVVVGAGVVGMTTAIALLDGGHRVRVVSADPILGTTSAVAAAVWFPTHVGPLDRVLRWGRDAFEEFVDQATRRVPGVVLRESLALYREPPGEPVWAAAVGEVRDARADELPPGYPHGLRFAVPLAEMPRYLPWLAGEIDSRGGDVDFQRLTSFAAVGPCDAVVNCTGLAAREMAADPGVYPVRGQVVRVANPGLRLSVRDEHHPAGRAYVHPRTDDCILGGTLDEHVWDTTVDAATAESIIERCCDLVPALRDAEVLGHAVGLRPGRPAVRLEEDAPLGTGARLVHNYGHGGAGMTLSWGCAREVAALLAS